MKIRILGRACIGVLILAHSAVAQSPSPLSDDNSQPLTLVAWYTSGDSSGEFWSAYLAPDGSLSVTARHMKGGHTMSHYSPYSERITRVREAIARVRFFQLPNSIDKGGPFGFHHPSLSLRATLGARQHSVEAYDPKSIGDTIERRRFFVVWDALFSDLPVRPDTTVLRE